ncbi:LLM class flavin-dependent oxidoreductase [Flavobacterium cellulosilyticum]|uniref:Luciferase-like monooxygenase n=1 Tax=Flavobacterium cellulosilyticum TaxID=2541731 RepID=A0A4R5CC42_9FLAO|nr:LLM class flavin-dependent oxidoreductase [Flavobacterium cellulosilyticum]TDD97005.1 LLM class flavin-dependent oxidoreductase [Flavobacterium cellulosilyticum]
MKNKPIAYSILDLAIVSKGKTIKETFMNTVALAQKAEELGYTRFWLAEHHNMAAVASSATVVLIGHVAQSTTTMRVGSGGIMLPNHAPLIVAEQFGTLGNLYSNRIDLGLGRAPGTDPETTRAIRSDFMDAAHSFPEEIEKIQNYFSINNQQAKVRATVAEGVHVPLYILGSSTDSAHLAARKGLPYAFASHFATAQLFQALDIYRSEFMASEVLQKPYIIAGINVFVAETDEEAERMATSFIKMIVGILTGVRKEYLDEASEMTADLKEILTHPTVQQMTRYTFIGSKPTVKNQIKSFLDKTEIDELIVATNCHNQKDRIRSIQFFAEIMSELNKESLS